MQARASKGRAVRIISEACFVVAAIEIRTGQGAPETAIRTGPSRRPCKTGVPVILTTDGGSTGASSRAQDASASVNTSAGRNVPVVGDLVIYAGHLRAFLRVAAYLSLWHSLLAVTLADQSTEVRRRV